jgi:hypothetical protein
MSFYMDYDGPFKPQSEAVHCQLEN